MARVSGRPPPTQSLSPGPPNPSPPAASNDDDTVDDRQLRSTTSEGKGIRARRRLLPSRPRPPAQYRPDERPADRRDPSSREGSALPGEIPTTPESEPSTPPAGGRSWPREPMPLSVASPTPLAPIPIDRSPRRYRSVVLTSLATGRGGRPRCRVGRRTSSAPATLNVNSEVLDLITPLAVAQSIQNAARIAGK